jgi:hypothetical protein
MALCCRPCRKRSAIDEELRFRRKRSDQRIFGGEASEVEALSLLVGEGFSVGVVAAGGLAGSTVGTMLSTGASV